MFIEKIHIKNFMPYYGLTEKTFNYDKDKNVILISGMNMEGKTSFLNSIRWCLYGKALARKSREIDASALLNTLAHSKGDSDVCVRLNFTHNGDKYELMRNMSFPNGLSDSPEENRYLKKNGSQLSPQSIDKEIASIMSYDVSRFFLFDGELLDQYEDLLDSKGESVEKIKHDIEKILGIPAVIEASKSLDYLKTQASKALAVAAKKTKELESYANNLKNKLDEKDAKVKSIKDLEKDKKGYTEKASKLEEYISKYESKIKISDKVNSIKDEIRTIKIERDKKLEKLKEEVPNVWKSPLSTLCQTLRKKAKKDLKDVESVTKTHSKKTALIDLLNDSLDAGKCELCDNTLSKKEISIIRDKIDSTETILGRLKIDQKTKIKLEEEDDIYHSIITESNGALVRQIEADIADHSIKINSRLSEKTKLEKDIKDLDSSKIRKKRSELEDNKVFIRRCEDLIITSTNDLKDINAEIDKLQQRLKDKGALTGTKLHDAYTILENVFSTTIDTLREEYKNHIEDEASKTFCNLTSDSTYKGLKINDTYGLSILDKNGKVVKERSAGAEHIVSLSLLNGLNKTSKSKAPIVMDTPFGRLDSIHTNSIIQFLGNFGEQLFLLTHDNEIDPNNVPNALAKRMNTHLRIEKVSSERSKINDK
jgi:DNA sulfur modification protein DndD